MDDVFGIIVPQINQPDSILVVDMFEMEIIQHKTVNEINFNKVSCLEKLAIIKSIYPNSYYKDNFHKIASIPFFTHRHMAVSDAPKIVDSILDIITSKKPKVIGYVTFANRFLYGKRFGYKLILLKTEPIDPGFIRVKNHFWISKKQLNETYKEFNYYLVGNELKSIFPVLSNLTGSKLSKVSLVEHVTLFNKEELLKNDVELQSMVKESFFSDYILNYVFSDFLINSYPSDRLSYPQFLGFAVARGVYIKHTKKLFCLLGRNSESAFMSYQTFLKFIISMDPSSKHVGAIKKFRQYLIFQSADIDEDNMLNEREFRCFLKRIQMSLGVHLTNESLKKFVAEVLRVGTKNEINLPISYTQFLQVITCPELEEGMSRILRYSKPYIHNTKEQMEYIMSKTNSAIITDQLTTVNYSLIPYFIEESYNPEQLFQNMRQYSRSYGSMQALMKRLESEHSKSLTKTKFKNSLSMLTSQIRYYISELSFDIFHHEPAGQLYNPLYLTLLATSTALLYPTTFNNTSSFWRTILLFFLFEFPGLFATYKSFYSSLRDSRPFQATYYPSFFTVHWSYFTRNFGSTPPTGDDKSRKYSTSNEKENVMNAKKNKDYDETKIAESASKVPSFMRSYKDKEKSVIKSGTDHLICDPDYIENGVCKEMNYMKNLKKNDKETKVRKEKEPPNESLGLLGWLGRIIHQESTIEKHFEHPEKNVEKGKEPSTKAINKKDDVEEKDYFSNSLLDNKDTKQEKKSNNEIQKEKITNPSVTKELKDKDEESNKKEKHINKGQNSLEKNADQISKASKKVFQKIDPISNENDQGGQKMSTNIEKEKTKNKHPANKINKELSPDKGNFSKPIENQQKEQTVLTDIEKLNLLEDQEKIPINKDNKGENDKIEKEDHTAIEKKDKDPKHEKSKPLIKGVSRIDEENNDENAHGGKTTQKSKQTKFKFNKEKMKIENSKQNIGLDQNKDKEIKSNKKDIAIKSEYPRTEEEKSEYKSTEENKSKFSKLFGYKDSKKQKRNHIKESDLLSSEDTSSKKFNNMKQSKELKNQVKSNETLNKVATADVISETSKNQESNKHKTGRKINKVPNKTYENKDSQTLAVKKDATKSKAVQAVETYGKLNDKPCITTTQNQEAKNDSYCDVTKNRESLSINDDLFTFLVSKNPGLLDNHPICGDKSKCQVDEFSPSTLFRVRSEFTSESMSDDGLEKKFVCKNSKIKAEDNLSKSMQKPKKNSATLCISSNKPNNDQSKSKFKTSDDSRSLGAFGSNIEVTADDTATSRRKSTLRIRNDASSTTDSKPLLSSRMTSMRSRLSSYGGSNIEFDTPGMPRFYTVYSASDFKDDYFDDMSVRTTSKITSSEDDAYLNSQTLHTADENWDANMTQIDVISNIDQWYHVISSLPTASYNKTNTDHTIDKEK